MVQIILRARVQVLYGGIPHASVVILQEGGVDGHTQRPALHQLPRNHVLVLRHPHPIGHARGGLGGLRAGTALLWRPFSGVAVRLVAADGRVPRVRHAWEALATADAVGHGFVRAQPARLLDVLVRQPRVAAKHAARRLLRLRRAVDGVVALDHLLNAERGELAAGRQRQLPLDVAHGAEHPARAHRALVLDGRHGAMVAPVEGRWE